jgi:dihydropyrimidinase
MLDMLIQGGRVVTPAGVGDWDVGVVGEKIVSVAFPGVLTAEAKQVIDARGKILVPGGIETHAHAVANVQPGARTLVAGVPNAGPLEHSLGAIWGGTRETWPRGFMTTCSRGAVTRTRTTPRTASTPTELLPT